MISSDQNLITSSLLLILSLHSLFESCDAICTPSSCGIFPNISSPFRLSSDPKNCGDPRFELACENNVTSIALHSHRYYVKAIKYTNNDYYADPTIRLVDASINNDDICSFPTYSLYAYHFTSDNPNSLPYMENYNTLPINFISCPNPLRNSSLFTNVSSHCASDSSHHRYAYIKVGHMNASEVPYTCGADLIAMTSWHKFKDLNNASLSEIHESLLYGFKLTICRYCGTSKVSLLRRLVPILVVILACLLCAAVSPPVFTICGLAAVSLLLFYILLLLIYIIVVNTGPKQKSNSVFDYGLAFRIIYGFVSRIIISYRIPYFMPGNPLLAEVAVAIELIVLLSRVIIFPFYVVAFDLQIPKKAFV
ncbi:LEAF RUST 10 DISEASE-RESISTANCE LOCUS RECEPTOR-LIKE PROTEIN KINASE-like 2.5 [Salvia divinorum]|uniref:LEAF RUST 10 DISEASE-RESISTANCE LOCUS RECEPTOR-LIKE PROTEIN KINASE-like 2.5 n=1 Tax=Salvia divinorum TaxID=28513 RepID=A0ABD1H9J2_SALDI